MIIYLKKRSTQNRNGQTAVEYALATAFVFALAMMFYILFERPTSNMSVMERMFERVEYSVIKPNP